MKKSLFILVLDRGQGLIDPTRECWIPARRLPSFRRPGSPAFPGPTAGQWHLAPRVWKHTDARHLSLTCH